MFSVPDNHRLNAMPPALCIIKPLFPFSIFRWFHKAGYKWSVHFHRPIPEWPIAVLIFPKFESFFFVHFQFGFSRVSIVLWQHANRRSEEPTSELQSRES